MHRTWALPLLLAVVVTLANAAKPVVVDDTAYLLFARHLAANPGHPYSFTIFWNSEPEPANSVLMPPVLPYWLAAGIAAFGERVVLLKLWLFPIAWVFTASLGWLLRRFARGADKVGLVVLVFSPAVLPQFNFMLDVPAVAFGLAAVALFIRSCERGRPLGVVAAGLLAGLAMQTKYSQLVVPAVFVAHGLAHRRWWQPLLAVAAGVALFAAWEAFVQARCGQSHFLLHFRASAGGDETKDLAERIEEKFAIATPLLSQFGGVALGFGLWGLHAAGVPKWVAALLALAVAVPLALVVTQPYSWFGNPAPFFFSVGVGSLAVAVAILLALLVKWRTPLRMLPWRWNRDTTFLALWLIVEILGAIGLSPFPAARRVIGVALVVGVLVARGVSRFNRLGGRWRSPRWPAAAAVGWGVALFAIDAWDADAEREAVVTARALIPARPGGTIWTTGHWGFQYYADVHGMVQLVPNEWVPKPGDWLVVPLLPDVKEGWFYRPWPPMGLADVPEAWRVERVGEVVVDDRLPAQTVPNLYGGQSVVCGRDHPRLKVAVYRFLE